MAKFKSAAVRILHPETDGVLWFTGFFDQDCKCPMFGPHPVLFPLRYALMVVDHLKRFYPVVRLVTANE